MKVVVFDTSASHLTGTFWLYLKDEDVTPYETWSRLITLVNFPSQDITSRIEGMHVVVHLVSPYIRADMILEREEG